MATIPNHQDLQVLEVLRKHRRQHREKFPTQVATHLTDVVQELTPGIPTPTFCSISCCPFKRPTRRPPS
jgi:hypothetical protein